MWPFSKRKTHKADAYFKEKFLERMDRESLKIVVKAHTIRHTYPDLSGPELVRLVHWGVSGAPEC